MSKDLIGCVERANEQQYEMSSDTLAEQLAEAEALLRGLSPSDDEVRDDALIVRVFCSWTPCDGQRAMSLSSALIKALAAVEGTLWMDFYPDASEEQATPR